MIVALGANLGDPVASVTAAFEALAPFACGPVLRSPLYWSSPVDCPPGSPLFVNAVAVFLPRPGLTPEAFLEATQELEQRQGRMPKRVINEARPLDLDLIAWGEERRKSERLFLPHPRAHLRRFVLAPLADLSPGLVLPGQTLTVSQLLEVLPADPFLHRMDAGREPEIPWNAGGPP